MCFMCVVYFPWKWTCFFSSQNAVKWKVATYMPSKVLMYASCEIRGSILDVEYTK